jgi:DNA-binding transcriptional MerR regulator
MITTPSAEPGLTIQEMARQSGLSEHTLRYYERVGLLTAIPRDNSSGHRRYPLETVDVIESLACLRGTGMSIGDMRRYLELRKQGSGAAEEQRALFAAHKAVLEREMEILKTRMEYLAGKVAFWEAIGAGDTEKARVIGAANRQIARRMLTRSENE